MQQYFVDDIALGQTFNLANADNHHAVKVMRMGINDHIIVVNQHQQAFHAACVEVIEGVARWQAHTEINLHSEMPIHITIATGLSKHDKLDLIIQKSTELGMTTYQPIKLQRDVVKWNDKKSKQRVERFNKIAKEAAEQCHRLIIPNINNLMTLDQLIQQTQEYDYRLVAYEEAGKQGEKKNLTRVLNKIQKNDKILIVFGSEGGLSDNEIDLLKENGFICCGLGPRILRAETAPLYALSAISYALELSSDTFNQHD